VRRILTEMMRDYFEQPQQSDPMGVMLGRNMPHQSGDLPVSPMSSNRGWSVEASPRRLKRIYTFEDPRLISEFLTEIFAYEAETGHNARITCEFPNVMVEIRTHDLDDVTELDQQYGLMCDRTYEDVLHYSPDTIGMQGSDDGTW